MTRIFAALLALSWAMPRAALASEEPALAHVIVTGVVNCKGLETQRRPQVNIWLADIIVSGREYHPRASTEWTDDKHVRFSFDIPGGVYELFAHLTDSGYGSGVCSWNGPLMTLPGVARYVTVPFAAAVSLWDPGDFVSGAVAGTASVRSIKLPLTQPCGAVWTPPSDDYSLEQRGNYYAQIPWLNSQLQTPGIVVTDQGHSVVLKLLPIRRAPLHEHAYYRRDISQAELKRWAETPSWSIVCDNEARVYGEVSPIPSGSSLQRVNVTAIISCSDKNDLYASENPALQVEDQLHRGRFYAPTVTILSHVGNVIRLRFAVPAGAYDLGMRLPRPRGTDSVLPCYSSMRFAMLPGYDRNLTQLICTCGEEGSNRGFVAGELGLASVNVALTLIPRSVQCGSALTDIDTALKNRTFAVLDGGHYYGTFNPYDPSTQPVLLLGGNGLPMKFVALDPNNGTNAPQESMKVLNLTVARVASWYRQLNWTTLLCTSAQR